MLLHCNPQRQRITYMRCSADSRAMGARRQFSLRVRKTAVISAEHRLQYLNLALNFKNILVSCTIMGKFGSVGNVECLCANFTSIGRWRETVLLFVSFDKGPTMGISHLHLVSHCQDHKRLGETFDATRGLQNFQYTVFPCEDLGTDFRLPPPEPGALARFRVGASPASFACR